MSEEGDEICLVNHNFILSTNNVTFINCQRVDYIRWRAISTSDSWVDKLEARSEMTRECTSNFPHQEVKRGGRWNHNIETPLRTTASRERCTTQSFPATSITNALTIPHPKAPAVEHISFFLLLFFVVEESFLLQPVFWSTRKERKRWVNTLTTTKRWWIFRPVCAHTQHVLSSKPHVTKNSHLAGEKNFSRSWFF